MSILAAGLALFFGAHFLPVLPGARERLQENLGEGPYKGVYSLIAGLGLGLMIWGYSLAPYVALWTPPAWTRHLALTLMVPAIVLLVAAYAPGGRIKAAVKHPMLTGVTLWSLAHLLANGDLASLLLFGSFLTFGIVDRLSVERRERMGLIRPPASGPLRNDLAVLAVGLIFYAAFVLFLHQWIIGVAVLS